MKLNKLLFLAMCGLFGFFLAAQADDPPAKVDVETPAKIRENAALQEQILARQCAQLEQDLHKLILKLKRSTKEGDKERAEVLEKVLEHGKNNLVGVKFEEIINQLKEQRLNSTGDIKTAAERSAKLAEELRKMIEMYKQDPRQ